MIFFLYSIKLFLRWKWVSNSSLFLWTLETAPKIICVDIIFKTSSLKWEVNPEFTAKLENAYNRYIVPPDSFQINLIPRKCWYHITQCFTNIYCARMIYSQPLIRICKYDNCNGIVKIYRNFVRALKRWDEKSS